MNNQTQRSQNPVMLLTILFALTVGTAISAAQSFTVIPPSAAAAVTGLTYGEWSSVWEQYVLSKTVTDPNNPLFDQTGKVCGADQPRSSPVFFLSGVTGGGTVTRNECTVPSGKVLFFPLQNSFDIHVPGDGLDTPELLRQDLLSAFGPITELHASIDGVAVGNLDPQDTPFLVCAGGDPKCSAAFSVTLPGNNLFVGSPAMMGRRGKPAIRAGVYSPVVAIGYYLMLAPLSPGPHTINFGGSGFFAGSPTSQEITYNLVVK